ncbi:MAG TPA: MFS transporter [Burkholderiales bacterium]|nr:MFS transporter [Burkholderiales bacterium]
MNERLSSPPAESSSWLAALRVYREPQVRRILLLGFSAGLPLLLVFGTLSFRLRDAGIERTTIGFISWVALAYAFKWAWSPFVDRLPLPFLTRRLGRRRSWLLVAQLGIVLGLIGMALADPREALGWLVICAVCTAFASATQDIALDAYRIECAPADRQAALAAAYQTGYRVAMIWANAGVLWIAARFDPSEATYEALPWTIAYLAMAASMAIGIATVWFAAEPPAPTLDDKTVSHRLETRAHVSHALARPLGWFVSAVVGPFADFIKRYRWHALLLLSLIAVYRISDVVMGVMANTFYRDAGFTKDQVAAVSGVYGVIVTLAGTFIGGMLAMRFGMLRTLFLGAVLSAATNLLFAWLALRGNDLELLVLVVTADNLSAGIATAAFIGYMSSLTNIQYSATQYALFSSLMVLLPKFIAGFSGLAVDTYGYPAFFIGTALIGAPVLLLVWLAARAEATRAPGSDSRR